MILYKVARRVWLTAKSLIKGPFWFFRDLIVYYFMKKKAGLKDAFYVLPFIFDKDPSSHTFDKHYVYMDRWAFKDIMDNKPKEHVDVGSSIRFLSMVTTVTKLKFVDIRPVKADFDNFEYIQGSILNLPFADNSIESLSCLHVAEHIGLGRYGDPLDINGTKKACAELTRVLAKSGTLYFAVPIGRPAVYFNSHRVHNPITILESFSGLDLQEFAAIDDSGQFINHANLEDLKDSVYACGCFKLIKRL